MPSAVLQDPPPVQLSLFDAAAEPSAPAEPAGAFPAPTPSPREAVPAAPAAEEPVQFSHPQADREVLIGGHRVAYALRRVRRRSIGFVVGVDGLTVSAPRWVGLSEVERALQEKAGWILRKLQEQRERSQRLQAARVDWRDGGTIPFLGETVILVLDPRATGAVLQAAEDTLPGVPRLTLHLGLPQSAAPEQIRDTVQSWLQRQFQHELTDVVFAEVPSVGRTIKAGEPCAVVESVKTASDIYAPVSGEVVECNAAVTNTTGPGSTAR